MGPRGNGNNQQQLEGNGNKAKLNLGLGMGMGMKIGNKREWDGKSHSRSSLCHTVEMHMPAPLWH